MSSSQQPLAENELRQFTAEHPEWAIDDGELIRHWEFDDFPQAIAFINRVAHLAEQQNHHPDIDIRYNRVKLALVSHDAGGITTRDTQLAKLVSAGSPAPAPNLPA
jgi:4a-hydroxytetrahydrobiopterin dehydratase